MAAFKTCLLLAACTLCLQQVALGRELQQLPVLPDVTLTQPLDTSGGPAPAPGPSSDGCALAYLQAAGNFQTLTVLVEAASESALLQQILASPSVQATLLAPTDAGIQKTLTATGLTQDQVLADPALITEILEYHLLPSLLQSSDLVENYSFNTELSSAGVPKSVTVATIDGVKSFQGGQTSAAIVSDPVVSCKIAVIPIDGLLIPSSSATAPTASA
jgi:uncharacterized surface protein with fasciclin (FAS1) repeats